MNSKGLEVRRKSLKKHLRGIRISGNLQLSRGKRRAERGRRRKVAQFRVNAKQYRAMKVAQDRALNPRIFRQYVRKISNPRAWALLAEIHDEIKPPVEILPGLEIYGQREATPAPVIKQANRRKTDGRVTGGTEFYSMGGQDCDADLSLSNSLLCETPRVIFEEKASE